MVISTRPLVELVPVQPAAMAAAARPVGQGLLRRRGLPEDRPARARDALGGRGVRTGSREAERADRPRGSRWTTRDVRADPGRGHGRRVPDREPRADADDPPHPARDARRHHGASRPRAAGADPGQGRPPVHRAAAAATKTRRTSRRPTIRCCRSRCGTRSASSSSSDQVLEVAMALAGFSVGEAEGLRRAMSRKRSEAALEAYRRRFVEGALGRWTRSWRTLDLRQARGLLGVRSRSRTRRRSGCSRTSRSGRGATTRPSSWRRS